MKEFALADTLHRLVKEALDSGAASSLSEAEAMFLGFRLHLSIGDEEAMHSHHQAALLTAVALANRVFLGGVSVTGPTDELLRVPLPLGESLRDAVVALGGHIGDPPFGVPVITIGGASQAAQQGFHIRTSCSGWRGGVLPTDAPTSRSTEAVMPLAPMLAAALAVNEAFLFVRTGNTSYGRRVVGMSLWSPAPKTNWLAAQDDEPILQYLPTNLWLIGLGHLGQAYLWGIGLLPYADPAALTVVLQDIDEVTPSSLSTSVLTNKRIVSEKKTRAMAAWAGRRGFRSNIIERRFAADFTRQPGEPSVALCGIDNALGRRALDQVGFDFVVEAGLGSGYRDFRTMRLHTLPALRKSAEIWNLPDETEAPKDKPGYAKMLSDGDLDECGITLLAGKAVGAPFVGAVAACLAVSEILRLLHGGTVNQFLDIDLQNIDHRTVVPQSCDFSAVNPGFTAVDLQSSTTDPCGDESTS